MEKNYKNKYIKNLRIKCKIETKKIFKSLQLKGIFIYGGSKKAYFQVEKKNS